MNLPLALLVLMGGGLLIYAGVKNPPGGVVGVLGAALQGQKPGTPLDPRIVKGLTTPAKDIPKTPMPTTDDVILGLGPGAATSLGGGR